MGNAFLIQVNAGSYRRLLESNSYENDAWMRKQRDRAQGDVEVGDALYFYCTGDVPQYYLSLACRGLVENVSPEKTLIGVTDLRWFKAPLSRDRIRQLVNDGELEDAFNGCGAQGFNIARLQLETPAKLEQLLESLVSVPAAGPGALDGLIETKLEEYIVQHWSEIDFGANLELYREDGDSVGQQYDTEVGRIDLLCSDRDSGDIVVIELKRGRPSDEVIGQLARYMGWARARIANGRPVKGIILAPDFDLRLRYAAQAIPGVQLLKYQTRFEITPEPI